MEIHQGHRMASCPTSRWMKGNVWLLATTISWLISRAWWESNIVSVHDTIFERLFLMFQGYGAVTEKDDFLATAYIQYFYKNLYPCFQYILWGDPVNGDASRTLYAKRCPFPYNFTHPAKYTAHTDELLQIFANFSIKDKLEAHNSSEVCGMHEPKSLSTFISLFSLHF